MKILFDYQIFLNQKFGGISNYFTNLISSLDKKNQQCKLFAPLYISEALQNLNKKSILGKKIEKTPKYTKKIISLISDFFFEFYSYKFNPDIIHYTYYDKLFRFYNKNFYSNKTKRLITVYDLIHENFYNLKNVKKKSINSVDHLICISKNTQAELIEYYKINIEKTSVVYLASKFSGKIDKIVCNKSDPYLLFVGDRFKYKNFTNFIKSVSSSKLLKNNIKIICFGFYPFTKKELEFFSSEKMDINKINFMSGDDELLKKLYQESIALVYPSLYEGFGLPILEAMSLGCPVACSNVSSMKEVGGVAVNYFNPNNIEEMQSSIEEIVFSSEKRKDLINLGFQQNKKFSWNKCANETLDVYKKII